MILRRRRSWIGLNARAWTLRHHEIVVYAPASFTLPPGGEKDNSLPATSIGFFWNRIWTHSYNRSANAVLYLLPLLLARPVRA